MAVTTKWIVSTRATNGLVTALSTELNSLASAAAALASAAIQNQTNLDFYADATLTVTYGVAPRGTAPVVELWMARSADNSVFEDASATGPILPQNGFIGVFPLRAVTTAQVITIPLIMLPPGDFKLLVVNKGGQAMAASGNTVVLKTYGDQAV